jgi:hypothetical protein
MNNYQNTVLLLFDITATFKIKDTCLYLLEIIFEFLISITKKIIQINLRTSNILQLKEKIYPSSEIYLIENVLVGPVQMIAPSNQCGEYMLVRERRGQN